MLTRKIKLWDINAHITCRLCSGYLIDATTVTECLHTFCRSCLVKYLEENNTCPTCRIVIHQSHPLQYIGHDRTMQDIVYKLVPGLQEAEMRKQREFYHKLGMEVPGDIKGETCSAKQHLDSHRNGETKADDSSNKETAEEKQEEDNDYHRSDEQVSICLECNSSKLRGLKRKWIRCSAQATVLHLKKFIAKKLNLSSFNELDILCNEEILGKDHTLKFVVVTRWRFKAGAARGAARQLEPEALCGAALSGAVLSGAASSVSALKCNSLGSTECVKNGLRCECVALVSVSIPVIELEIRNTFFFPNETNVGLRDNNSRTTKPLSSVSGKQMKAITVYGNDNADTYF
ncbi:Polycomb group RING finger protein 3 [Tupaia chinensis]|uniref:Polycomb group RING finger protein 3 n=1 Tax=Tupaia chinensis TaxID=246437 RepID=L9L481_TUPCH|nr:Polycomb group RING finger protein 3 [Tupaia chinensis]